MAGERALRVAVVEDDRGLRESLSLLLDGTPGFACAGAFASAEEALRRLSPPGPDVILSDVNLPGRKGSEAVPLYRARCPASVVLMLTVYDDEERIFESLCGGASGYLLKKTPPDQLLALLSEAASGGAPMSPEVARKVIRLFRELPRGEKPERNLTPQEVALLRLLDEGASYQTAADRMGVSINTVRNHVRSVYEKLHVSSKSAAVGKALRAGLI